MTRLLLALKKSNKFEVFRIKKRWSTVPSNVLIALVLIRQIVLKVLFSCYRWTKGQQFVWKRSVIYVGMIFNNYFWCFQSNAFGSNVFQQFIYGICLSRKKSLTIRLCFDSVTLLAEKKRSPIYSCFFFLEKRKRSSTVYINVLTALLLSQWCYFCLKNRSQQFIGMFWFSLQNLFNFLILKCSLCLKTKEQWFVLKWIVLP